MASCFVYASKFRRQKYPVVVPNSLSQHLLTNERGHGKKAVQNAHDWIWLGKSTATLETQSVAAAADNATASCHRLSSTSSEINVIANPRAAVDDLQHPERIPLH